MFRTSYIISATAVSIFALTTPVIAQSPTHTPHMIVVKLVEREGAFKYAFDPATIEAERGDTLRFVQAANAPHNVRFTKEPEGVKLGRATVGPYLYAMGAKYDLVLDGRFADGMYDFVCDPHSMIGMKGTLSIAGAATAAGSK
jgi:plastocyanin